MSDEDSKGGAHHERARGHSPSSASHAHGAGPRTEGTGSTGSTRGMTTGLAIRRLPGRPEPFIRARCTRRYGRTTPVNAPSAG